MKYNKKFDLYVSTDGLLYRLENGKLVLKKFSTDRDGYFRVNLSRSCEYTKNKKHRMCHIHTIVADTFFGERPKELVIDHINRNRQDNRIENLRYVTQRENSNNSKDMSGQNNPMYGKNAWDIIRARRSNDEVRSILLSKSEKMKKFWAEHPEALEKMRQSVKRSRTKEDIRDGSAL